MENEKPKITRLKQIIFEKQLKQWDLAEKTKINRSYLSLIVNGKLIPTTAQRESISKALDLPLEEVFADCPESWTQTA